MKTYRKTATVKAKIFEKGDEDGMQTIHLTADFPSPLYQTPYISTLKNQKHFGKFGKHYLCVGIDGERWLVDKNIFERTYKEIELIKNLGVSIITNI